MSAMVMIHVRETAERRGIKNAYGLQLATGLSPDVTQRLWRGEWEKIGKETLDRLCRALRCQPGKLLTYEPDGQT
jgi:DNA-binding Xre family transcriptional regulator